MDLELTEDGPDRRVDTAPRPAGSFASLRAAIRRLPRLRLRTQLGAAALAALMTAVALGALLLLTAGAARNVVLTAQLTHDRVQAYSILISATRSFQNASYADAHSRTLQTMEELEFTRGRYLQALEAALALPRGTPEEQQLASQIDRQGQVVTDHLGRALDIVTRIDTLWRTEGRRAAGLEAERSAIPVRELVRILDTEVRRGDEAIGVATGTALRLSRTVLVACLVCLCLAVASWAIIQLVMIRRLLPGLRQLEQGTLAFASGNLGHRVSLGGNDELAALSTAFDSMADQLADKQATLRQVQVGLEQAVRKRTEELERANHELSASDGRRRAFLADIGHELRTPLTIIRGEAQVALRELNRPGFDPQEPFERIVEHTHDLSRMVEDLFLIARAEAGGLPLQIERVDLQEIIERVAGDFESLAADRGASVAALPGDPVFAAIDPDRLRRALAALVDNALRHTHDRVRVTIEARRVGDLATIAVCDDGPGVDPTLVPDLFQRFRRGHTRSDGSGLGLSLVRALAEAQGGRARLENRSEGGARALLEFGNAP